MLSIKKAALKTLAKVVKQENDSSVYEWPPICIGIFHQPRRPIKLRKD